MDDQTVGTISLLFLLILNQCEQCNNTIVNSWAIRKKKFKVVDTYKILAINGHKNE